MKDKHIWFGYLKSADKQTLVLRDDRLETGKASTVYLYNQDRDEIVEYSKQIIEPKLQDAGSDKLDAEAIVDAYMAALRRSKPNTYNLLFAPAGTRAAPVRKAASSADDNSDDDIEIEDNDFGDDDEDWEDDSE